MLVYEKTAIYLSCKLSRIEKSWHFVRVCVQIKHKIPGSTNEQCNAEESPWAWLALVTNKHNHKHKHENEKCWCVQR